MMLSYTVVSLQCPYHKQVHPLLTVYCVVCRQYQCPQLPADQRPPRPRKRAFDFAGASSGTEGGCILNMLSPSPRRASDCESLTEVSLCTMPQPKGLIDALSGFFTPTDKRTSRVSLSSRTVIPILAQPTAVVDISAPIVQRRRGRPPKMSRSAGSSDTLQQQRLIHNCQQQQLHKQRKLNGVGVVCQHRQPRRPLAPADGVKLAPLTSSRISSSSGKQQPLAAAVCVAAADDVCACSLLSIAV